MSEPVQKFLVGEKVFYIGKNNKVPKITTVNETFNNKVCTKCGWYISKHNLININNLHRLMWRI